MSNTLNIFRGAGASNESPSKSIWQAHGDKKREKHICVKSIHRFVEVNQKPPETSACCVSENRTRTRMMLYSNLFLATQVFVAQRKSTKDNPVRHFESFYAALYKQGDLLRWICSMNVQNKNKPLTAPAGCFTFFISEKKQDKKKIIQEIRRTPPVLCSTQKYTTFVWAHVCH